MNYCFYFLAGVLFISGVSVLSSTTDDKFLPYEDEINWKDICIMIPLDRIEDSFRIMKLKTEVDIGEYRENIQKLYKKYFTREGVCEYILRKLNGS